MSRVLWERYKQYLCVVESVGLRLDISRMKFGDEFLPGLEPKLQNVYAEMAALESGAVANPDEKRLVGHDWLRDAARAPTDELRRDVEEPLAEVQHFAADVHAGRVRGERGHFTRVLVVGIGGSVLGPQLVASALTTPRDRIHVF